MLLSGPQLWWAYLALISNAAFVASLRSYDSVVLFDNAQKLCDSSFYPLPNTKYLMVFWDGISNCAQFSRDTAPLGPALTLNLKLLLVGNNNCPASQAYEPMPLYAEGELAFRPELISLEKETARNLRVTRAKALLTPAKNLLKRSGTFKKAIDLLFGAKRLVFCGAAGLNSSIVGMLNNRYGGSPAELLERAWCSSFPDAPLEEYLQHYRDDLATLLRCYEQQSISDQYFVACIRLLDRDYFLARVRSNRLALFTNQFGQYYIDVYSTPFYSHHVFLDFGSTVGPGNYPRLADLKYYKKKMVEIPLMSEESRIVESIRDGSHEATLDAQWNDAAAEIARLL